MAIIPAVRFWKSAVSFHPSKSHFESKNSSKLREIQHLQAAVSFKH